MAGAGEVRKREQRAREAVAMTRAAAEVRRRGVGFAGLDDEASVEAVAALLEELAASGGLQVADRVWEQAVRTATRVTGRSTWSTWTGPSGPSPAGHRPPASDRSDWPLS